MVSLPLLYRNQLHECVTDSFRALCNDLKDDTPSKAPYTLPDVIAAVAAVQSVVNEAFADFKEQWNYSNPDPIMRLPVELRSKCFGPLAMEPLAERVAISHVSRAWRRVALAERRLWTRVTLDDTTQHQLTRLSTLLSRSRPLPCQVSWEPVDRSVSESDAIIELLIQNMDRIQSLEIYGVPYLVLLKIFYHPAPILQELTFRPGDDGSCELPRHCGSLIKPSLKVLSLEAFFIPDDFEPLPSVRNFHGYLPRWSDGLGLHNLFNIFPDLESLHLVGITSDNISLFPTVPQSVAYIHFETCSGSVDFSSFINDHISRNVRRFHADGVVNVAASIDAFAMKVLRTWSMAISSEEGIALEDNDSGSLYSLTGLAVNKWWREEHPFMRRLDSLAYLSLPMAIMMDFASQRVVWNRVLPSLRTLTLTAGLDDIDSAWNFISDPDPALPVHAAQLEDLVLEITTPSDEVYDFVIVAFPDAIPLLVSYGRAQLKDVRVEVQEASQLHDCDLGFLARLAQHVQVQEDYGQVVVAEFLDGEPVRGQQLSPSFESGDALSPGSCETSDSDEL